MQGRGSTLLRVACEPRATELPGKHVKFTLPGPAWSYRIRTSEVGPSSSPGALNALQSENPWHREVIMPALLQALIPTLCMLSFCEAMRPPSNPRKPTPWGGHAPEPPPRPSTHPALPAHTEAEGVLIRAARPIVHHSLHGHHLAGLLGLAVEVAPLLGWKGSGRMSARRASCTAGFLPKLVQEKHHAREKFSPDSSWDTLAPLPCHMPALGLGQKAKGGR